MMKQQAKYDQDETILLYIILEHVSYGGHTHTYTLYGIQYYLHWKAWKAHSQTINEYNTHRTVYHISFYHISAVYYTFEEVITNMVYNLMFI